MTSVGASFSRRNRKAEDRSIMSAFGNEIEYAARCRRSMLVPPFHGLRNLGRRAKLKLTSKNDEWQVPIHRMYRGWYVHPEKTVAS